ncbi:MAG TPA: hypothetical protein VMZ49_12985 [Patescibacteria group bacterium]|nr:hypothetical protein [Patescibacteria group bacterium]
MKKRFSLFCIAAVLVLTLPALGQSPVVVAGSPPLTRQGTDAFLEALFFMAGEVSGQRSAPEQKTKDNWAQSLAAEYPKMSAEQNRRFQMHMSTSNAMMNIYKINYNTQANFSGNPYRYW